MPKHMKSRKNKIGSAPGSLIHVGERLSENVKITLIKYDKDNFSKILLDKIEDCFLSEDDVINWIDIDGLHEVEVIEKIGKKFNLHPLVLEDILNTTQRPKVDFNENYIYIVLKMLYYDKKIKRVKSEQVSFIVLKNHVFSFQEFEGDVFDDLRKRLEQNKSNIRNKGADYLIYSLVDAIVDSYFDILESIGDTIDDIEDTLMSNPSEKLLSNIYELKREMIFLRNSIWPLRDVLSGLVKSDYPLITDRTTIFLKDVYDHSIQVMDIVEIYRDILSGMLDTYLSSMSNKTNEVMKVLTVFSTIFIPLSFFTGIYGMNFEYMPELSFKYGYLIFWIVTIISILIMIRYFRKKSWL